MAAHQTTRDHPSQATPPGLSDKAIASTSFFVSIGPDGHHKRPNSLVGSGTSRERDNELPAANAASVRSSLRRQGTFRQDKPTVLSLITSGSSSSSSSRQPSTSPSSSGDQSSASSAPTATSNTCDNSTHSDVLIDLNQATTSGYCQPSTSRGQHGHHDEDHLFSLSNEDLSPDEQDHMDGLDEEFTPPPSYMEVIEDTNLTSNPGHNGTL